ncbi:uncharacterized protein LOC107048163 [Diachasma alloeum]|uniref:uncharacterized protein LOC107048163 n=1 Tax=Diachasma alloeum TaxID=454923 RepID=UPI00073823BA|nr:uncharacterized protein LOC107048163 [Diachasma alloeum]
MHETFHEDPTDISKRRPRRLRGTPANKWSAGLSFAIVAIFAVSGYCYSESSWSDPIKKKIAQLATVTDEQRLYRLMMQDALWNSSVKNLKKKQAGELMPPVQPEA